MQVKISEQEDGVTLALHGNIDEHVQSQLAQLGSKLMGKSVVFDFAKVSAINSIGTAEWIAYLRDMGDSFSYQFTNVPHFVMDTIVLMPNFVGRGKVASFTYTYRCSKCNESTAKTFDKSIAGKDILPDTTCSKCGTEVLADEDSGDYIAKLK